MSDSDYNSNFHFLIVKTVCMITHSCFKRQASVNELKAYFVKNNILILSWSSF